MKPTDEDAPELLWCLGAMVLAGGLILILYIVYAALLHNSKQFMHVIVPASLFALLTFCCGLAAMVTASSQIKEKKKKEAELRNKAQALRNSFFDLAGHAEGVSPQDFLQHRAAFLKNGDFTGVYLIQNISKHMNYVGQSVRVVSRLSQHFTGHGNGDVYADYIYGDVFQIKVIPLNGSGYASLDALERDAIAAYHAFDYGYNKTRGNSN